jgi:ATP-binding cassette subfamily B protein
LLLRLYEIHQGRITLDGVDIRDLNSADLRQGIGLVSQDVFLFHGTVAENIAYGTFAASQDEIAFKRPKLLRPMALSNNCQPVTTR